MKKVVAAIAVSTFLTCGLFINDAFAGRMKNRQIYQHQRIAQGIQSGELTKGETAGLVKEQQRIRNLKVKAWSDGMLTPKEKWRLENAQDRSSRHIYRLKHNNRSK